ncbi:unnamed protein product [Haemonchus placei]|uniref:Rhoptry-associated protein 1 n=1 Tax=Haemonchus placei TaxID=6290 RepID=A0A0N4X431_HAEPC|nr:unnamed protein product [Haemonchus placei]
MVFPLSLLLFGMIAGISADYEDQDRPYFSNDGTLLPGTAEDSNGMNNEDSQNNIDHNKVTFPLPTNFGEELAELSKTNPILCRGMEKLYKNITAMETDLRAKYLFFSKMIEIFKNLKQNITGYDNPALIFEKALHSVSEESRKTIGDFLNFNARDFNPNIPYQQKRADPFELELAVVALYDTLQKLHDIAIKLDRGCGELLKTYFEYYLSDAENEDSNSHPFNNLAVPPDAIKEPLGPYLNAESEDSNSYPFNNGAVRPDAIKEPLGPYLNGINIETNFHEELAELSKINPVLYGVMEELHKNIIARESDLKAKYLFFGEIIETFKKKKDIIGSDDPASILGKALYSVPAERRDILVDFLSSNEKEVDFAALALYDILQKLCDIAIKLNPDRGESLKPYFNYYLGAHMRYNTSITHYFSRVGKVAQAAEFC